MTRYLLLFDSCGFSLWSALSYDGTVLSFVYATGLCQRSLSRVRVPWDSQPYFAVSDLRLPFSSPPATRRVTVEVFDPASRRGFSWIVKGTVTPQRLTVSQSVSLGVEPPSGAHDQIFITV
jgi:hypothetical protein